MIPESPTDEISDFLEFCSHIPGPRSIKDRVGASPFEVRELASLCGRDLPRLYEAYLLSCGRSDGGLDLLGDADARIQRLIDTYKDQSSVRCKSVSNDMILIASEALDGSRSLLYRDSSPTTIPIVVQHWATETYVRLAESFLNYIYSQAYQLVHFPESTRIGACLHLYDPPHMSIVRECLLKFDFSLAWFSDEYQCSLEGGGGRFVAVRPRSDGLMVCIDCGRAADTAKIKNALLSKFPFKDHTANY